MSEIMNDESAWSNLEWWEDEIWILESLLSPKELKIYMTFLVDPQAAIYERKRGEHVWAAKAALGRLKDWLADEGVISLSLSHNWEKQLPDFLKGLDEPRDQKES